MHIKSITFQHRRDFTAVYECEHCGSHSHGSGYDDLNFHNNVIPNMPCNACGKTAALGYTPLQPKYEAHEVI
jgi:hypothetical protein